MAPLKNTLQLDGKRRQATLPNVVVLPQDRLPMAVFAQHGLWRIIDDAVFVGWHWTPARLARRCPRAPCEPQVVMLILASSKRHVARHAAEDGCVCVGRPRSQLSLRCQLARRRGDLNLRLRCCRCSAWRCSSDGCCRRAFCRRMFFMLKRLDGVSCKQLPFIIAGARGGIA